MTVNREESLVFFFRYNEFLIDKWGYKNVSFFGCLGFTNVKITLLHMRELHPL